MQLEIIDFDRDSTSYTFNNVSHVPNVGDSLTIFKNDESGDIHASGTVKELSWTFIADNNDYTVTVTLQKQSKAKI